MMGGSSLGVNMAPGSPGAASSGGFGTVASSLTPVNQQVTPAATPQPQPVSQTATQPQASGLPSWLTPPPASQTAAQPQASAQSPTTSYGGKGQSVSGGSGAQMPQGLEAFFRSLL